MGVPDKVFSALAMSHKGVEMTSQKNVQTFEYDGTAFAILQGKGAGALKLGAPQHDALLGFCRPALTEQQTDGWTYMDLSQIDMALLADYVGAAYRTVAPKVRLSL
ncbi:MAG: hypothetical protein ACJAR9_001709 [Celeribacter sp.]|jgi:hypothetical protein